MKKYKDKIDEQNIDLERIKNAEYEILLYFDDFCKRHQLQYYLFAGTLLGAARHQGFIPWDDDIDIAMPREDYNKLIQLFDGNNKYFLQSVYSDKYYTNHYAKVLKNGTSFVEYSAQNLKCKNGMWVDIFPINPVPSSSFARKKYFFLTKLLNIKSTPFYVSDNKKYKRKFLAKKLLSNIILFWCSRHKAALFREKYIDKFLNNKSNDIVVCGLFLEKARPANIFTGVKELKFVNKLFPVPENYDSNLSHYFGDYMKLPPIEQQVAHHYVVDIKY